MNTLFSSKRLRWLAALIVIFNGAAPAIWILFTSLKGEAELTQLPITYLPQAPTMQNFALAFADQPLLTFLLNSGIVAVLSTISSLFVSTLAAYAIARLKLRFRGAILTGIIAGLLAQGLTPFDAACVGAWAHGRAGEKAAKSNRGLLAHEVADTIPVVLRR